MSTPVAAPAKQPDPKLATALHRLSVASYKLDMVVRHYPAPGECDAEDLDAIAITREVAGEIGSIYAEIDEWAHAKNILQDGPLVESWNIEETPAAPEGVQP